MNTGRFVEAPAADETALAGTTGSGGTTVDTVANSIINLIFTDAAGKAYPSR